MIMMLMIAILRLGQCCVRNIARQRLICIRWNIDSVNRHESSRSYDERGKKLTDIRKETDSLSAKLTFLPTSSGAPDPAFA
jgi:hypothetical protein